MLIAFQNSYSQIISAAIMVYDTDACGSDGNFSTHGWWVLNPGESKAARWTSNQYVFYYAEAVNGARWDDPNGPRVYVYPDRFDSCLNIGSTAASAVVGMRRIDIGWPPSRPFQYTINLTP
jgi:uncharacterized membrane protein